MDSRASHDTAHSGEADKPSLENPAPYQIGKTTFVVERMFRKDGAETIGSILVKLVKSEVESSDIT